LLTDSTSRSSSSAARTTMGSSGPPCVTALPIRLDSTCWMRGGSQRTTPFDRQLVADVQRRVGCPRLVDHVLQPRGQEVGFADRQPHARAQPHAREVEHVVDQAGHAARARLEPRAELHEVRLGLAADQQLGRRAHRGQRVAQVMAQHGDELLAQLGRGALGLQRDFGALLAVFVFQLARDQVGEGGEHRHGARVGHVRRPRVDGAQVAEVLAVGVDDRHRDVALDVVEPGRVVVAVHGVGAGVVDDHRQPGRARFHAERGFHLELAAGLQAELDRVFHRAGGPGAVGHAGHGGEAHAGVLADDLEQRGHRADAAHGRHVPRNGFFGVGEGEQGGR
jgi:hypothetical protein